MAEPCCAALDGGTLSDQDAIELERVLRVMADRTRLKILNQLIGSGEAICVCDFVPTLGLAQPTVSYHLKQLAEVGLVERERRGSFAYYSLTSGALERLSNILGAPALAAS